MDASTISAAYTGFKIAVQNLRTIIATKADIAADARVIDAFEKLGTVQDTLFELRNALADLQEQNHGLKEQMRAREGWDARAAQYALVAAPGGAMVYRTMGRLRTSPALGALRSERSRFCRTSVP